MSQNIAPTPDPGAGESMVQGIRLDLVRIERKVTTGLQSSLEACGVPEDARSIVAGYMADVVLALAELRYGLMFLAELVGVRGPAIEGEGHETMADLLGKARAEQETRKATGDYFARRMSGGQDEPRGD